MYLQGGQDQVALSDNLVFLFKYLFDGGVIWRNTIPVVFNNNNNSVFTKVVITCTYRPTMVIDHWARLVYCPTR